MIYSFDDLRDTMLLPLLRSMNGKKVTEVADAVMELISQDREAYRGEIEGLLHDHTGKRVLLSESFTASRDNPKEVIFLTLQEESENKLLTRLREKVQSIYE